MKKLVYGLLFCSSLFNQAWAANLALLIGNNQYSNGIDSLANPINDAKALEAQLKKLGFKTTLISNANRMQMLEAIDDFSQQINRDDTVVFYYAGHGASANGNNYLIPSGAQIPKNETWMDEHFIDLDSKIASRLSQSSAKYKMVIMDACRNNPIASSRSAGDDRTFVRADAGQNAASLSFLYSASKGQRAADGRGTNSPFTTALISKLNEPNLTWPELVEDIGVEVSRLTNNQQKVWQEGNPLARLVLNMRAVSPVSEKPIVVPENPQAAEIAYWDSIKNSSNASDYAAYLQDYPRGRFANLAKSRQKQYQETVNKPSSNTTSTQVAQIQVRDKPQQRPATGQSFKDCADCPEMVQVPEGSFMMGSKDGYNNEQPVHKVTIAYSFAVGKYEVTFSQWDACVADGGCNGHRPDDKGWGRGNRPVMNVSWDDAKSYVQWLSRKTGKNYRLLSESEWEYVARAGETTQYSWGNDIGVNRANCDGCGSQWDNKQTAPVGSFAPNQFGLYDVLGNVWEWVEDCWQNTYGGFMQTKAPSNGNPWLSNCSDERRVLRGGSWFNSSFNSRLANRGWNSTIYRSDSNGFRVCVSRNL